MIFVVKNITYVTAVPTKKINYILMIRNYWIASYKLIIIC